MPDVEDPAVFHYMLRTVEVVLFASRSGEERRNVIHYRYGDGSPRPSATELTNLGNDVIGSIIDQYEDFVVLGTTWYKVSVRDVEDANGAYVEIATNRVSAGGSQVMPGGVSLCLSKRTARAGRSFRGRFYLIDCDESMFNGDDLNPAFIPAIDELATALLLPRQAGRFLPSVGSRKLGGSTPMASITYDRVADYQRRRGKGRGR
jgi:hypothetical protein